MARKASDHALAAIKASANLIPVVGGALASLIGDYIPTATQRAVETTLAMLGEKLKSLEGRIDLESVDREEFAELFKSSYFVMIRSHRQEKLQAAANLLVNLFLKPNDPAKISYNELDHFVRCLDALSVGALSVLSVSSALARATGLSLPLAAFAFADLRVKFPQLDPSLVMSLATELRSLNLIQIQEPAIPVADYANYLIKMTPVGDRFAKRLIAGEL